MRSVRGLMTATFVLVILTCGVAPGAAAPEGRAAAPEGRAAAPEGRAAAPEGQMTWALHFTLAPTWFDPAETSGIITPYVVLYALHDAMVKPLPGNPMGPALAESWSMSPDGLVFEFVLRKGVKFHNGETV